MDFRRFILQTEFPFLLLSTAVLLSALPLSAAEPSSQDRVVARGLFDEARALLTQNQLSEACPKFAESFRLDPKSGTLLNLAVCHEREGRTATAWLEYKDALSMSQRDARPEREQMARERIAIVEPNLSRLTIVVPKPTDRADLEIRLDGAVLGRGAWNMAMPIDPGVHTIRVSAPGMTAEEEKLTIGPNRDLQRLEIAPLQAAKTASKPVVSSERPIFVNPGEGPQKDKVEASQEGSSRFGAFARADIDGKMQGAVPVLGLSYRLGNRVDLGAGALLGSYQGGWIGSSVYVLKAEWKPMVQVGVPVFFRDGARPGIQGGLGLEWDASRHTSFYVLAGMTHFFSVPDGVDKTSFVPTIGMRAWL